MVPVLGKSQTQKLIDTLLTIEAVTDVRTMRPMLQA